MILEYTIKKSKGKNVRISINRRGEVFLHVPRFVPNFIAKRFLESKREWLLEKVQKVSSKKTRKQEKEEYIEKKEVARKVVLEKLEFWKKFYKENFQVEFIWNKVAIKNTSTRWGSCSSKKNLNFSYKIIDLSVEEKDYLIVHELCHLQQMNHSDRFWSLVSLGIPNWKIYRKFLKKGLY